MLHLTATSPADYQRQFYEAIGLASAEPPNPAERCDPSAPWEFWENPDVGFVHGFGSMERIHCGIGSYTIPSDLLVHYDYEFSYLHFGIIYRGVTYSLQDGRELTGPSPAPFVAVERSPAGTNLWKAGQQERGTEISVHGGTLEQEICPALGLLPSCLDTLEVNRRYTKMPNELQASIRLFEENLVNHRMTEPLMVGLTCSFVAQLCQPETLAQLLDGVGRPVEHIAVGQRALALSPDELGRVRQAHTIVAEAATSFPRAAAIAREVGLSEQKLKAGFSHLYHRTLGDFAHSVRMEEAARLLRETSEPVGRVSHAVGYQSEAAFIAAFKRWGGTTPLRYRRLGTQPREV